MEQENVKVDVTLGQYRGLVQKREPVQVEEYEIQEQLERVRHQMTVTREVQDRPVADGDVVRIDYEGFTDGKPFYGGKGTDYDLTIGSHSFIDTFEEQLVGHEVGDRVEVQVTFPEQYHASELAGKPALFLVDIKAIKEKQVPELNDEFAKAHLNCESLEVYRDQVRSQLRKNKDIAANSARHQALIAQAAANAVLEVPEDVVTAGVQRCMQDISMNLSQQGVTLEKYLQMTGATLEQILEQIRPQAEQQARVRLVLEAIVREEKITVSEEEVEEQLEKMAAAYRMDLAQIKSQLGEEHIELIRGDLAVQKAADIIISTSLTE